jgi:hypothetical protein
MQPLPAKKNPPQSLGQPALVKQEKNYSTTRSEDA